MNCRCNTCDFKIEDYKVSGVAAPYNKLSRDLGGFVEVISQDAFVDVLETNPDVIACVDHSRDSEKILGSTTGGTLSLKSTDIGLEFELEIANTTAGNDILTLIKRGDITKLSFAFSGAVDKWSNIGSQTIRTIYSFGDLHDISFVKTPAYDETQITA